MLRNAALLAIAGMLWAQGACSKSEGGDAVGSAAVAQAGSAAKPGGGFSAELSKELGMPAKVDGSAAKPGDGTGSAAARTGSAGAQADGSAGGDPAKADSDATKAAGAGPGAAGSGDAVKPAGAAAGSASDAVKPGAAASTGNSPPAGSAAPPGAAASDTNARTSAAVTGANAGSGPGFRASVHTSTELAAIKLSLLPNWDRDIDEPGTFQYVVRIKGTQSTKTFSFHYGYDDPRAPTDRDQYKKYLQDQKIMVGDIKDRQRGAAWFLEGTDPSGLPVFRYVVLYGGKHLICYGSLYKDADSNRLGDDRDQTVIQAKQICETLAL